MNLPAPTPTLYTFGSMSLGSDLAVLQEHVAVARRAMEAGVWFHSSPTYQRGFTFMVLRMAFDEDRSSRPPLILKIRDGSAGLMRFEAEDACRRLGIDGIDVAQLVSMSPDFLAQLAAGEGPIVEELASLRGRGLIRSAVVFIDRRNAEAAVRLLPHPLVEGVTLYWNALQRDCAPGAWEEIVRRRIPTLALRTLGGGPSDAKRAGARARLHRWMTEAGCEDETVFNLRLAASYPGIVRTTIGGTANPDHLRRFIEAAADPLPLPEAILEGLEF